jgi:hypothetical protein
MLIKALGLVLLAVLILVGALMPLRYTANMQLPKRRSAKDANSSGPDQQ